MNLEEKEIELTDEMAERANELDNAVYQMLLTMLQLSGEEAEKDFPWNIRIIRKVLDFLSSVLQRGGNRVCNPYISHSINGSYQCTPSECGCGICRCQSISIKPETKGLPEETV